MSLMVLSLLRASCLVRRCLTSLLIGFGGETLAVLVGLLLLFEATLIL